MSTTFFGAFLPSPRRVRLAIFEHMRRDARATRPFAEAFEANKRAFKERRKRECQKVSGVK